MSQTEISQPVIREITHEEAVALLEAHAFKVAKTMPGIPHSYTLRKTWDNQDDYNAVFMHVQKYGKPEKFYSKTYRYLYANGYKYWTCGEPLAMGILINRAEVP